MNELLDELTENALTDTVSQCEGRMLNAPFKDAMSFQTQGSILARLQPPHWEPALVTGNEAKPTLQTFYRK